MGWGGVGTMHAIQLFFMVRFILVKLARNVMTCSEAMNTSPFIAALRINV